MNKPDAWKLEEFDSNGQLVWSAILPTRPSELSWFKDLPTKKHNIVMSPMYIDKSQSETFNGVKAYKESTQRLIEAGNGL
jgi:hypothetical protein